MARGWSLSFENQTHLPLIQWTALGLAQDAELMEQWVMQEHRLCKCTAWNQCQSGLMTIFSSELKKEYMSSYNKMQEGCRKDIEKEGGKMQKGG